MEIIASIAELQMRLAAPGRIAFVPTMGNLHAGHLALVNMARQQAERVVVSIFVNPLQFGVNEDLANYPRTLQEDCEKLREAGVDLVFTPTDAELYPSPQTIQVQAPPIALDLCGTHRPGHFTGVCTVVAKLFNIIHPQVAIFGKKDYQQLFVLREMVRQLNMPVEILAGDTWREADGLAMSSRNNLLKPAQRLEAPRLHRALQLMVQAAHQGRRDFTALEAQTTAYLTQLGWIVDYISIRNATNLLPPQAGEENLIVLGAARLGATRLIDNIEFAL